jgi:hypothetical protein
VTDPLANIIEKQTKTMQGPMKKQEKTYSFQSINWCD